MNLKNYTSSVPVDRSIARIEEVLVGVGASHISKTYVDGKVTSIKFSVRVNDNDIPFKLPAKVDVVKKLMFEGKGKPSTDTVARNRDAQAARTAWKILVDWTEIQASMIKLEQAEFVEVFMPYVYLPNGKTYYESMKEKGYKALLGQ